MRIIGEIPHPTYKISVLHMNEKTTIQIEDGLLSQSYTFRDGTGIKDLASAQSIVTELFLKSVFSRFQSMKSDYVAIMNSLPDDDLTNFDII